jgi:hypothetical protein
MKIDKRGNTIKGLVWTLVVWAAFWLIVWLAALK